MDESWRISMASVVPRRRSTEQPRRNIYRPDASDPNVDDFSDVFGGPPRTLLHLRRRFSTTDFGDMIRPAAAAAAAAAGTFYDEIFMPSDRRAGGFPARSGRNLAGFRIPEAAAAEIRIRRPQVLMRTNDDGFYDDIFGRNGGGGERMRSRSRSKTTTSNSTSTTSVLINNSEEEEEEEYLRSPSVPLRRAAPNIADDAIFSSFASKLRPITIPVRRRRECSPLSAYSSSGEDSNGNSNMTFSLNDPMSSSSCFVDLSDRASTTADFFQQQQQYRASTTADFFQQQQQQEQQQCGISTSTLCSPSPPPPLSLSDSISSLHYQISLLQKKHRPGCCSGDISDIGSPSSVVSSSVFDPHPPPPMTTAAAAESSFLTEIDHNSCCHGMGETEGAAAIDEAIAWAKEKYWNHDASNKSEVLSMIRHHDMIDSPNASAKGSGI